MSISTCTRWQWCVDWSKVGPRVEAWTSGLALPLPPCVAWSTMTSVDRVSSSSANSVIFKLAFLWLLQTVRLHRVAFRTIPSRKGGPTPTSSGDLVFNGFPLGDPYKISSAKKILFLKYFKNIILDDLWFFHLFTQFTVYVCLNSHLPEEGHGNPRQCSGLESPEPGGLQSMGSQRVRHDGSDLAHMQAIT